MHVLRAKRVVLDVSLLVELLQLAADRDAVPLVLIVDVAPSTRHDVRRLSEVLQLCAYLLRGDGGASGGNGGGGGSNGRLALLHDELVVQMLLDSW